MLRKTLIFFMLMAMLVPLVGQPSEPTVSQAQTASPEVLVRFVHAFEPGTPQVDLYMNGNLVAANIGYKQATPHLLFPTGNYLFELRLAGSPNTAEPNATARFDLASSNSFRHVTIVIQASATGEPELAFYTDDLTPTAVGNVRFNAIHTVADAGPVDLVWPGGVFLGAIAFGQESSTIDPPVAEYAVTVNAAGTSTVLFDLGTISTISNMLYTVVIVQNPTVDTVDIEAFVLEIPFFPLNNTPTVLTSIVHGSNDAGAVDVYFNETRIAARLLPGAVTKHVPLPAGQGELKFRPAGSPANSEAAHTATVSLLSETGALTVVALGSLGDETFTVEAFEDVVVDLEPTTARVRVINALGDRPVNELSVGTTVLATSLAEFTAGDATDLASGVYTLNAEIDVNAGPILPSVTDQSFVGGTFYNILVYNNSTLDEPIGLTLQGTQVNTTSASMPGAITLSPPIAATTPEATSVTTQATPAATPIPPVVTTPPPVISTPAPVVVTELPQRELIARVSLDEGVNLQCREYPSADAFSLGLVPNGTELELVGYAGPADPEGEPVTPVVDGTFDDPESATEFEGIWLRLNWFKPEGGVLTCWSRADFLLITYRDASRTLFVDTVEEFFSYRESDDPFRPPLVERVPYNFPGGAEDTPIVPPTPVAAPPTATVNVDPGVNLNLRRLPDPASEIVARVPGGTDLLIIERTQVTLEAGVGVPTLPDWLYVEYDSGAGAVTGWISVEYVLLSRGGRTLPLEEIPVADEVLPGEGSIESGSTGAATPAPFANTVFGALNTTGNLNLREAPNAESTVLLAIPPGAVVVVLGRNGDGTWLNVRYEVAGTGASTGWVQASFVNVTQGGVAVPVRNLPITSGEPNSMP